MVEKATAAGTKVERCAGANDVAAVVRVERRDVAGFCDNALAALETDGDYALFRVQVFGGSHARHGDIDCGRAQQAEIMMRASNLCVDDPAVRTMDNFDRRGTSRDVACRSESAWRDRNAAAELDAAFGSGSSDANHAGGEILGAGKPDGCQQRKSRKRAPG